MSEIDTPDAQEDARLACQNLISSYFKFIDDGQASKTASLMTDDCEIILGPNTIKGLEAFRVAMTAREADRERKSLHVSTNIQFGQVTSDAIVASSLLHLYVLNPEPVPLAPNAIIECRDRFARGDGGEWRFSRRELHLIAGKA